MPEDDITAVKFISTVDGEYGFVITTDQKLRIMDVDNETAQEYNSDFVDELLEFLKENW